MLTLKQLRDNREDAIRRLKKKGVDAEEIIARIEELDNNRKALQNDLDNLLAQQNQAAKQIGALMAKGRLLGVQFETLFTDGLYHEIARGVVQKAIRLKEAFVAAGYKVEVDSPTNQQFFRLPNEVVDSLKENVSFEMWGPRGEKESVVRFVTGWTTTDDEIDQLISYIK